MTASGLKEKNKNVWSNKGYISGSAILILFICFETAQNESNSL